MRNVRFQPFLLALLLGLSAFGMGCRQSEEPESDRVAVQQDAQEEQDDVVTQDPEIQPEERVVVVEPETGEDTGMRQDLEARERQLAERQADLDARERRLREQTRQPERQARVPQPPPVTKTAKPAPRVEREEPVRPTEPERTEEMAETRDDDGREAAELEQEREAREREEQARLDREEREEETRRPAPLVVNVPAGTVMEVEFLESLSSQTAEAGDIFRARVSSDVSTDGAVGIPAGSEIVGVVTEAVPLRKVGGQAKLALKFTDLVLPSGKTVPIQASFASQGRSETRKDAATIGGAAAGGAILGRVLSRKDRSRGAVIGAIIGAAAGAAIASKTPGEEVTIERGTKVDLKLDNGIEVRARGK